ncbi:MAG: histidinol-phosphate transaminase [Armatimonadota bacterium]
MSSAELTRACVRALTPYTPGKPIEEVQREYGLTDIVKLASNENPLGPSPKAVEAICKAAPDVRLYPDNDCYHLRRAVADHLGVAREQVLLGHGSDELIHNIGLAFICPGDEIMMCAGPFSQYEFTARLMEAEVVAVPLDRDWRYDLPEMARRLTERTKVIFIGNPNNPTGTIVKKGEMTRFMADVPDRVIVVMDEAYSEYVDDSDYAQGLPYVAQERAVIVLRTFSKIYALAGLRVGYGATTPELAAAMERVREPFTVTSIGQAAASASLEDKGQVTRSAALNRESKQYLYGEFKRLGLRYTPTQANFVWVDVGRDCRDVFVELLKRGVIVRTGDVFGAPTHIRVTTGLPEQNERFVSALGAVL